MYKNSSYSHGGYAYDEYQDHQDYADHFEGSHDYANPGYQQQYKYPPKAAKPAKPDKRKKSPPKAKNKPKQFAARSQDQFDDSYDQQMPQSSSSSQYNASYGYTETKSQHKKKPSNQGHRQVNDYGTVETEQYDGGYHNEWYDDRHYPPEDNYHGYDDYGESGRVNHSDYDNQHGSPQGDAYHANHYGGEGAMDYNWSHKNEILEHAEKRSKYQGAGQTQASLISTKKPKNTKQIKAAANLREEPTHSKKQSILSNQKPKKGPPSDKKGSHPAQHETQKAKSNLNQISKRRQYICYVCKIGLQELEQDFYPCNCKYQICFGCYYHQVNECERKCPNCHKHYEVARVEEYKQNRILQKGGQKDSQDIDLRDQIDGKSEGMRGSPSKPGGKYTDPVGYSKLRTDEDIPFLRSQETQKLIASQIQAKSPNDTGFDESQKTPTVRQKYDLVSKNNQDYEDKSSLQNYKFQYTYGQEPEDSENMDITSLKSSQTYQVTGSKQTKQQSAITQQNMRRRTNSQENRITSQFLNQSMPNGAFLQFPSTKGIKPSKVRIIQQAIIYVIGLSPQLAEEAAMRRLENFGQYGKIITISLNREKAYSQHLQSETAENSSSSQSQTSYGAYITYKTPEEASLAILALDQHMHEGRMIRASYGRTKYCKFFLKKVTCQNKSCPYYHRECSDSDILTPDDMQKKALYQYSQQLAISISRIAEMTDSQFRAKMRNKLGSADTYALPGVETIFQNQELMSRVNLVRSQLQNYPQVKKSKDIQPESTGLLPKGKSKQLLTSEKALSSNIKGTTQALVKGKKGLPQTQTLQNAYQQNNSQMKQIYKQKAPVASAKIDKPQSSQVIRQLRSGSQRDNHRQESKRKLLEPPEYRAKAQALPLRPNLTPRRNSHSYSRMLSQSRTQIQLGDIKKKHQGNYKPDKVQLNNKVTDFIAKQNQKQLNKGMHFLKQNAINQEIEPVEAENQELREGNSANNASKQAGPVRRLNRMLSKENLQADKSERDRAQLVGNSNTSGISRNKRYYGDRRKSVSKSIQRGQRETSLPSLFDYTLKFLNDDMAITTREQEPLIEQIVEDDVLENQSQLNKRIFPNQMLNQLEEQYDAKSSYFSNGGSRGQGEINLKTMNNIYTSHCFLINSQNHKQSYNESVHQIWEKFDSIDNQLTLKNLYSNSENKFEVTQHDSFSQQDKRHSLLMQSQNNMAIQQPYQVPANGLQSQNAPKEQLQNTYLSYYRHAASQSQMNVTAQPFFQKSNNSAHHSGFNQPQNSATATAQVPAGSHAIPTDGFNNLSGAKNPQPVLNEKNLYLFNRQQEEQFDRQRHWSNIFLPAPKQVASSRGAITEGMSNQNLNGNIKSSTNNLLTSQSVFCFPIGVDSHEEYHEGPKQGDSVQKLSANENLQLSDKIKNDIKSNGAAVDNLSNFEKQYLQTKRKSMYTKRDLPSDTAQNELINTTGAFSGNHSPQKQSKGAASKSIVQPVTKAKMGSNPSLNQEQTEHTNTCRHSNMQKSNTNELYTADGFKDDDFDRRSAGERFGNAQSSAYQELMRVNNMFSSYAFKRRNSCSKSQSHSRVRIQPSIYHNEEDYIPLKKPDNQQNNINQFQNTQIDLTQVYIANTEGQGSLESLLSPLSKNIEASPLKANKTSIKKSWSECQK